MRGRPQRLLLLAALGGVLATATTGSAGQQRPASTTPAPNAPRVYNPTPLDRYEPAGGCYVLRNAATGGYVTRSGTAFRADGTRDAAAPLRFQAYDLGKYLLFGDKQDFLAAAGGGLPGVSGPAKTATGNVKGTGDENLNPVRQPVVGGVEGGTKSA